MRTRREFIVLLGGAAAVRRSSAGSTRSHSVLHPFSRLPSRTNLSEKSEPPYFWLSGAAQRQVPETGRCWSHLRERRPQGPPR